MRIFLLIMSMAYLSFGQSFELKNFDDLKQSDYESSGDDWMFAAVTAYADVVNSSNQTVQTNLIVDFIQNPGHVFAICDNENCYTDITDDWSSYEESGKYMQWPAGESDDNFIVSGLNFKMSPVPSSPFLPENQNKTPEELFVRGVTIIDVTLQNVNNEEDFVKFQVRFEASLDGILSVEVEEIENSMNLYPNPAKNEISINYTGDKVHLLNGSEIQIFDLQGNLLLKEAFANSKTLGISSLPSGKYFQRITLANGEVATKPFVKE